MTYKITEATNFIRIFRLPKEFPSGYCFDGGHPACFQLVDWFNPFDSTKFWEVAALEFEENDAAYIEHINGIKEFIAEKEYAKTNNDVFLAITDYGDAFLVNPERKTKLLKLQLAVVKKACKEQYDESLDI